MNQNSTEENLRHDHALAQAFDGQAAAFERAPVQSDSAALARLVAFARLEPNSLVLDVGCGPGLVAEALLESGQRVLGIDLSIEMIQRAQARCARFGDRASFQRGSLFDAKFNHAFDASISRYVLHHVQDPEAFIRRQFELLKPGGVLVLSDHTTDPDPSRATAHEAAEKARDHTHTRNLTPGALVDLLAHAGLENLSLAEEPFNLDFDEWFDRGTPALSKDQTRALVVSARARGFFASQRPDGAVSIACWRALVRGRKPAQAGAARIG